MIEIVVSTINQPVVNWTTDVSKDFKSLSANDYDRFYH